MRVVQAMIWTTVVLIGWAAASDARNLTVLSSDDPKIAVGESFDENRSIHVVAGATVVLRAGEDGQQFTLDGPWDDVPAQPTPDASPSIGDATRVLFMKQNETKPSALAVTRGMLKKAPTVRLAPWEIDAAHTGESCPRSDRPVVRADCALPKTDAVRVSDEGREIPVAPEEQQPESFQAQLDHAWSLSQRSRGAYRIP